MAEALLPVLFRSSICFRMNCAASDTLKKLEDYQFLGSSARSSRFRFPSFAESKGRARSNRRHAAASRKFAVEAASASERPALPFCAAIFERDALVCRMLIDKDEAICALHQDIKLVRTPMISNCCWAAFRGSRCKASALFAGPACGRCRRCACPNLSLRYPAWSRHLRMHWSPRCGNSRGVYPGADASGRSLKSGAGFAGTAVDGRTGARNFSAFGSSRFQLFVECSEQSSHGHLRIMKTDFAFCGVSIYVHRCGMGLKKQQRNRVLSFHQSRVVSFTNSSGK